MECWTRINLLDNTISLISLHDSSSNSCLRYLVLIYEISMRIGMCNCLKNYKTSGRVFATLRANKETDKGKIISWEQTRDRLICWQLTSATRFLSVFILNVNDQLLRIYSLLVVISFETKETYQCYVNLDEEMCSTLLLYACRTITCSPCLYTIVPIGWKYQLKSDNVMWENFTLFNPSCHLLQIFYFVLLGTQPAPSNPNCVSL